VSTGANRILTTHTGSLPRPEDLIKMMWAQADGVPVDEAALEQRVADAVTEIVNKQLKAGVSVVNDGEMSKPSYATYVKDRLDGFGGESIEAYFFADLVDYPRSKELVAANPGRRKRTAPACNAPITVKDPDAAVRDMEHLNKSVAGLDVAGTFSGAAAASCTACDGAGEFSVTSDAGSSYCSVAGAGKKPLSGRNGVDNCAAGKFSEGGGE